MSRSEQKNDSQRDGGGGSEKLAITRQGIHRARLKAQKIEKGVKNRPTNLKIKKLIEKIDGEKEGRTFSDHVGDGTRIELGGGRGRCGWEPKQQHQTR